MASYHEQGSASDVDTKQPVVATHTYTVAERRKAALAEVDNAKFSYVVVSSAFYIVKLPIFQLVPCQSLHRRWCRFLHGCVCTSLYTSLAYSNLLYFSRYDIFAINIASTMLGYLYGAAKGPSLNAAQSLGVKVATPVGTFCGQLLFGWLADVVGRKKMCMYSALSP